MHLISTLKSSISLSPGFARSPFDERGGMLRFLLKAYQRSESLSKKSALRMREYARLRSSCRRRVRPGKRRPARATIEPGAPAWGIGARREPGADFLSAAKGKKAGDLPIPSAVRRDLSGIARYDRIGFLRCVRRSRL